MFAALPYPPPVRRVSQLYLYVERGVGRSTGSVSFLEVLVEWGRCLILIDSGRCSRGTSGASKTAPPRGMEVPRRAFDLERRPRVCAFLVNTGRQTSRLRTNETARLVHRRHSEPEDLHESSTCGGENQGHSRMRSHG